MTNSPRTEGGSLTWEPDHLGRNRNLHARKHRSQVLLEDSDEEDQKRTPAEQDLPNADDQSHPGSSQSGRDEDADENDWDEEDELAEFIKSRALVGNGGSVDGEDEVKSLNSIDSDVGCEEGQLENPADNNENGEEETAPKPSVACDKLGGDWMPEVRPLDPLMEKIRAKHQDVVKKAEAAINLRERKKQEKVRREFEQINLQIAVDDEGIDSEEECNKVEIVPGDFDTESAPVDAENLYEYPQSDSDSFDTEKMASVSEDKAASPSHVADTEDQLDLNGDEVQEDNPKQTEEMQQESQGPTQILEIDEPQDSLSDCDMEDTVASPICNLGCENEADKPDQAEAGQSKESIPSDVLLEDEISDTEEKESVRAFRRRFFQLGELEARDKNLSGKDGNSFVEFEAEMSDDEGHTEDENEDEADEELAEFLAVEDAADENRLAHEQAHESWNLKQDERELHTVMEGIRGGWRRKRNRLNHEALENDDDGTLENARKRRAVDETSSSNTEDEYEHHQHRRLSGDDYRHLNAASFSSDAGSESDVGGNDVGIDCRDGLPALDPSTAQRQQESKAMDELMSALVSPAMSRALADAETDPMKLGCPSQYSPDQAEPLIPIGRHPAACLEIPSDTLGIMNGFLSMESSKLTRDNDDEQGWRNPMNVQAALEQTRAATKQQPADSVLLSVLGPREDE